MLQRNEQAAGAPLTRLLADAQAKLAQSQQREKRLQHELHDARVEVERERAERRRDQESAEKALAQARQEKERESARAALQHSIQLEARRLLDAERQKRREQSTQLAQSQAARQALARECAEKVGD